MGGHLSGGVVVTGGATGFAKHGDLTIHHPSNPFKRPRINAETVSEWEDLAIAKGSVAGTMGQAAATAALPGAVGKALGAGLGAALNSGHAVRINWADGKLSIIELPEKQFTVLQVLLKDRQIVTDASVKPAADAPAAAQPGVAEKIVGLASSVLQRGKQAQASPETAPAPDIAEQIAKLGSLHAQGILTDAEFAEKKAELLKRL